MFRNIQYEGGGVSSPRSCDFPFVRGAVRQALRGPFTLTNPLIFSDSDWPEFISKSSRRELSGSGGRDAALWRSYWIHSRLSERHFRRGCPRQTYRFVGR